MEEYCQNEINAIHRFFVDWFTGLLPPTDEAFARLTDVLDERMVLISPAGTIQTRDQLLTELRQAHGTRAHDHSSFRIWIEDFRLHYQSDNLALVTYKEWQAVEGQLTTRLSTAFFREKSGTPNNVIWLHVHETWL